MKIEIEITEEEAACLWSNNFGDSNGRSVEKIAHDLVVAEAHEFRKLFPNSVEDAVNLFRKAND